jgi:RNA polymerase sigma-70 factor (ECF subfamily)
MMTETFETYRPLLFSIVYQMLGSVMDAEDIVQETYLRYQSTPRESIRSTKNFLATIATRLALNHLRSARVQREQYLGPWIPEPIVTHQSNTLSVTPENRITEHETVAMAFMVLLESLTPVERAVFLLREVFEYNYSEIGRIVEKNEAACRQIFSRAKKHVAANRPRFDTQPEAHHELVQNFIVAVERGELDGIMNLLADDVALYTDGGGKTYGAATLPVYGRENAGLFIAGSLRFLPEGHVFDLEQINGQPGVIVRDGNGNALGVLSFDFERSQVKVLRYIGNPDKLKRL